MIGGTLVSSENYEEINSDILLKTIIVHNPTVSSQYLQQDIATDLITMANDAKSGGISSDDAPVACDFYEDYDPGTPVIIEPHTGFIFIYANANLLGYLNFSFVDNPSDNKFKLPWSSSEVRNVMAVYINDRCSFSRVDKNKDLFNDIRRVWVPPENSTFRTFSIGKYLWKQLLDMLQMKKEHYSNVGISNILIFNHSTEEALPFHLKNGMRLISDKVKSVIKPIYDFYMVPVTERNLIYINHLYNSNVFG